MTLLPRLFMDDWFTMPTSKRYTFSDLGRAQKENYKIYEQPNGTFAIVLEFKNDTHYLKESVSTRQTLDEAIEYVKEQVQYFTKKTEGPKLVWDGADVTKSNSDKIEDSQE